MTPEEARTLALSWAAQGIPAFPIALRWNEAGQRIEKRPLTVHGHLDGTTDTEALLGLFHQARLRAGERWGVGLWPGPAGYLVLDVDVKGGARGMEELASLASLAGLDVSTYTRIDTPSGGCHLWGRKPPGTGEVGNYHLTPAIEVRADKGWVVAPGTTTDWGGWG